MQRTRASAFCLILSLACCSFPAQEPVLRGSQTEIRLSEFQPRSMLQTRVSSVPGARFPVIDVHNHTNDTGGISVPADELVRRMDALNLEKLVILTGGWGNELDEVLRNSVRLFPDRFVVFTELDWSQIDDPEFGTRMVRQVREAVSAGARGLKITKVLGLGVRDKTGQLVPVDDDRLDPIWAECGRLGIPVAIHVSDPEAFFHPADRFNERFLELSHHPDWSFCCPPEFPTKQAILDARDRVLEKHPQTTFIGLHVGNWPENLDKVQHALDRYPNFYVETGARQAELGRQPRRARQFLIDNADRILFGTDMTFSEGLYRNNFRWLETADEYFDYYGYPEQGLWKIYGLELPEDVLEKLYNLNADKILSSFQEKE